MGAAQRACLTSEWIYVFVHVNIWVKKKIQAGGCIIRSKSQRWQALAYVHYCCFVYSLLQKYKGVKVTNVSHYLFVSHLLKASQV